MTIEVANRLLELRKKSGLSQEELADKLGISRQAVSKWERAEASPDTDNLIELARLYNVSLDELLGTGTIGKPAEENPSEREEAHVSEEGIHVIDGDEEVHVGSDGIHVVEGNREVHGDYPKKSHAVRMVELFVTSVSAIAALAAYITVGVLFHNWATGLIFLLIPVIAESIVDAIYKKKICEFSYPVLVTFVFLFLGLFAPKSWDYWFLFITIPVFYVVFGPVDKAIREARESKEKNK